MLPLGVLALVLVLALAGGLGAAWACLGGVGVHVDQAAVDALASLTQLDSLQLHYREVQGGPALKASTSSVQCIDCT